MTLASRKPTPNLHPFCGQKLKSVQSHCYLGVQISTNTLNWTAQCNSVARKAQQTLGVIRRNLNKCTTLQYASASWDPHCLKHIKTLERIERQAARCCTQNYSREPGTVTQLLTDLQWDTFQTRRKLKRFSIIYQMEHKLIDIPLGHYIQHNTRSSRKHDTVTDSQFLQIRYSANIFGNSFFPTTLKEWNSLPPITVSSKSLNSFQNNLIQHFNN